MTSLNNLYRRLNDEIDLEIKDWPALVRNSDPGPSDAPARCRWVESARAGARRPIALQAAVPTDPVERAARVRRAVRSRMAGM